MRTQRSENPVVSEHAASELLTRIASILLRLGVDAPNAQRLLRQAFVIAARDKARNMSERTTQSRIASIAGISRLEVRSLLSRGEARVSAAFAHQSTRIEKVVGGWRTDPIFTKGRGQPRSLVLRGAQGTFEHLAKKYGRDVTPKALQDELVQRGLARVAHQKISLLSPGGRKRPDTISAESDLKSIVAHLGGINFNSGTRAYVIRRATVATPDRRTVQMLKGIAVRRIEAVLNSMAEMSSKRQPLNAKKDRRVRRLIITAMVASESEEEKQ